MKKTWTILAALALGAGTQVTLAADPKYDALLPAEDGIEYVEQGATVTYEGKEGILTVEQNAGASTSNRTAIVKDGLGTLYVKPDSADNKEISFSHSLVVREGTMVMQGVTMTNVTKLESPNLTVGGNQAHLVLDGATYEKPSGAVSAIIVGGRDGDGTLTLCNGSKMWNCQAILAGFPSFDVLSDNATNAHVAGTYKTGDKNDGLYRDKSFFSADYTYSGGDPECFYMSTATINVLGGSTLAAGTFIQTKNAVINIDGEGSLLQDASYGVSDVMDNNLGEAYGSDSGKYQPKTVVNIRNGGKFRLQDWVTLSHFDGGSTEILVSGEGSVLQWDSYAFNFSADTAVHRSESLITVEEGGTAIVAEMYMGRIGEGERTTVVRVADSLSTYDGDVLAIYADALFENRGTTDIAQCFYVDAAGAFVNAEGASLILGAVDAGDPHTIAAGAYLVNDGQMSTGSVCLVAGTLAGSGRMGSVQTEAGSTVYAGGTALYDDERTVVVGIQPSAGSPHFDELTLGSDTSLVFYVDGDVAATEQNAGAGTYSNISVAKGGLTVQTGSVSADLVLGSRAFKTALSREDKAIPLQLVSEQAESADGAATDRTPELDLEYALSGERAELFSVDETGMLRLVLSPDAVTAATVYGAADLLNSLWTSTGMVQDFARKALMTQTPARLSFAQPRHPEGSEHVTGIDLWGSGLGYFSNMGGAQGFDFNSGGYAVGCDAELLRESTQSARVGLAFGQSFGTFKSDIGSKVDQEALMFALYGGAERKLSDRTSLYLGAYAAYGRVDNDARTRFMEGSAGYADWDDDVWSFGLQAELNFKVSDYFTVSPFTGIDYVYGSHGSFLEDFGDGLRRSYSSGSMQVWRVPVGVRFSTMVELGGNQVLLPELSVAYVGDVSRSNPHATVDVAGSKARVHGSNPGRSALMLQAGATWIINDRWSTGAAYHLEARSGQTAQGLNAYVRYRF